MEEITNNKLDELLKRAKLGDVIAQNTLGNLYSSGDENVELNYTEAIKWYIKAAESGYLSAQYNLALCYESGEGVEKSMKTALEWMIKAADQEDIDALRSAGLWLYRGSDEYEPDVKKGIKYLH